MAEASDYNFVPMENSFFDFENEGTPTVITAKGKTIEEGNFNRPLLSEYADSRIMVMTSHKCRFRCKMHFYVVRSPELYEDEDDSEPEEYSAEGLEEELMRQGAGWFIEVKDGEYHPLLK